MARNETVIAAAPEAVFELLADPRTFSRWVVGSRDVRAADESWPAPGSAFDHSVGFTPVVLRDHTSVAAARPPAMLELRAHARPLPTARITMHLRPEGDGTRVTMIEDPANPLLRLLIGPLGHAALRLRNLESLRRLKELAEGRSPRPTGTLPTRGRSSRR